MSSCPVEEPLRHAGLVCVVDPDPAIRRSVAALLRALGAEVEGYATAREFLARLSTAVPLCVVAESRLPDMSGIALIQELRARGLQIPTILLSADADVNGAVTAMRAGALDFIEKPYIDRALVTQVAPILDVDDHRNH
jgi:two-component system, LuxR family, response regulator FixJ